MRILSGLLLLVMLVATTACGAQPLKPASPTVAPAVPALGGTMITLPFVTIAQGEVLGDAPANPAYLVISKPEQWGTLRGQLPQQVIDAGRSGMQKESARWVIIAYGGVQASSGYSITIQRIERYNGDRIAIVIEQTQPAETRGSNPAKALMYHIIALRQTDVSELGKQVVVFRNMQGVELAQLTTTP